MIDVVIGILGAVSLFGIGFLTGAAAEKIRGWRRHGRRR